MNLKRAVEIIDGGARLKSIRFITADINKGKGGEVIELLNCRLSRKADAQQSTVNREPSTANGQPSTINRAPNHHYHFTRNLLLPNNQIRKVHPLLVTHLNQEEVI